VGLSKRLFYKGFFFVACAGHWLPAPRIRMPEEIPCGQGFGHKILRFGDSGDA
jgi:hypothetical protein